MLALALLTGCASVSRMLPGPPVLSPEERAAYDTKMPSGAAYTGPPRTETPVLPLQVWGLRYALDVVLVSNDPDWNMHEYARVDLPSGPLWLAKDADKNGDQHIVADLPDITGWVPEVPAPRTAGKLVVTDHSTATTADLAFAYTNPHGEPTVVTYKGKLPTKPENPRNGNTMGHSRKAVAVLLDLHLFSAGGDATVNIGGKDWGIKKLLGLYPEKFILAQTQGGFAVTDFAVAPAAGGFTLTRPGTTQDWPTAATESWTVADGAVRHEGPILTTTYHYDNGELVRADVKQVGVDPFVTNIVFQPALPDLRRPFTGTVHSTFAVDIAGQQGHGIGTVDCAWADADTVKCALTPTEPRWFADRPMETTVHFDGAGGMTVKTVRVPYAGDNAGPR